MVHQCLLVGDVHRIHLHVRVVLTRCKILQMHIVCRSNEELFLLLLLWVAAACVLLLLQLHVSVFILAVRQRMIQALRVVPSLLSTGLIAGTLSSGCMRQLKVVILSICIRWNSLHMQATAIHRVILCITDLLVLRHLDVQRTRLVLVEQVVELVVCRAVHSCLLGRVHAARLPVVAENSLVVA